MTRSKSDGAWWKISNPCMGLLWECVSTDAPVGQAVISNLVVNAGTIHFEVATPGATRVTYLQQSPGSPAFAVLLADSQEGNITLTEQPDGLHRYKMMVINSGEVTTF